MKKQLLIAGGTGLIGSTVSREAIKNGWEVTILSRQEGPGHIVWDPKKGSMVLAEPRSFDAIINLAGASIAGKRWTEERKNEIVDSRVDACLTLERYLKERRLQTSVYVGASAVGIYGDRGNQVVDEATQIRSTKDWMTNTVIDWEAGHKRIESLGIRTAIVRIGIVLSPKGGALREIIQTAPYGLIGYFGSGVQIWPWIHIDDLVSILLNIIGEEKMHGTYLAVSPHPVSNKDLAISVSKQFSPRRVAMPVPVFILSLMMGKMHEMLLQSCNGHPTRLLKEEFIFRYGYIDDAIKELLKK